MIHEENRHHQNVRVSSECQEEAKTGQAHLFGNENGASESLRDSLSVLTKPL